MPVSDSWGPTMRPGLTGRWLSHSPVAAIFVAMIVAGTACGSSAPAKILNTKGIERAIQRSSWAQRGIRAKVRCPSGVPQKRGLVFSCTAVYRGGTARFVVTELDGSGHVHYVAH